VADRGGRGISWESAACPADGPVASFRLDAAEVPGSRPSRPASGSADVVTVAALRERAMADFARIEERSGLSLLINLDYVTRIRPGLDPQEPTTVQFAVGRTLVISAAEGRKLIEQLNRCCVKRKEK
jgi:hypothetical protein